jgi:RNA polymerase sigma factor (TIGR02999 family)
MHPVPGVYTQLLREWSNGDPTALPRLMPLVTDELRKLARIHMSKEAPDHTLQPSALINEAFLRLVELRRVDWESRKTFFGAVSKIMRNILVDYARRKRSYKRGGQFRRVEMEKALGVPSDLPMTDLLAFNEVLNRLTAIDSRKAKVMELWYFGGLTAEEIAGTLDIGDSTARRDLHFGKVWVVRELHGARSLDNDGN